MAKHVVSTGLIVLYALLALYVLAQLVIIFKRKHKKTGYKAFFHYFTLVWSSLRSIFWLTFALELPLPETVFYPMFWLPQSIQYMTFGLLAVFLTKVTVRSKWSIANGWKVRAFTVYILSSVAYLIGTLTAASLAGTATTDEEATYYGNIQSLGSAIIFLLLSFVFAVLAAKLCGLPSWEYNRMFLFRPRVISSVTATICAVFASRSIFNFLTFAQLIDIDIDRDDVATDISAAAVYTVWEFFPILLLLMTIAAGPKGLNTSVKTTTGSSLAQSIPAFGVFGAAMLNANSSYGSSSAKKSKNTNSGGSNPSASINNYNNDAGMNGDQYGFDMPLSPDKGLYNHGTTVGGGGGAGNRGNNHISGLQQHQQQQQEHLLGGGIVGDDNSGDGNGSSSSRGHDHYYAPGTSFLDGSSGGGGGGGGGSRAPLPPPQAVLPPTQYATPRKMDAASAAGLRGLGASGGLLSGAAPGGAVVASPQLFGVGGGGSGFGSRGFVGMFAPPFQQQQPQQHQHHSATGIVDEFDDEDDDGDSDLFGNEDRSRGGGSSRGGGGSTSGGDGGRFMGAATMTTTTRGFFGGSSRAIAGGAFGTPLVQPQQQQFGGNGFGIQ